MAPIVKLLEVLVVVSTLWLIIVEIDNSIVVLSTVVVSVLYTADAG